MDTAAKRASAVNISSPWRGILPFPDGVIGQGDRQTVAFMYSGILAGAAVAPTPVTPGPLEKIWPGTRVRRRHPGLGEDLRRQHEEAAEAERKRNEPVEARAPDAVPEIDLSIPPMQAELIEAKAKGKLTDPLLLAQMEEEEMLVLLMLAEMP